MESPRFKAHLAHIGIESDGQFKPDYFVGVMSAGYTWARQAPWEGARHGPFFDEPVTPTTLECHRRECRPCADFPERTS